jgi:hypothetical protein
MDSSNVVTTPYESLVWTGEFVPNLIVDVPATHYAVTTTHHENSSYEASHQLDDDGVSPKHGTLTASYHQEDAIEQGSYGEPASRTTYPSHLDYYVENWELIKKSTTISDTTDQSESGTYGGGKGYEGSGTSTTSHAVRRTFEGTYATRDSQDGGNFVSVNRYKVFKNTETKDSETTKKTFDDKKSTDTISTEQLVTTDTRATVSRYWEHDDDFAVHVYTTNHTHRTGAGVTNPENSDRVHDYLYFNHPESWDATNRDVTTHTDNGTTPQPPAKTVSGGAGNGGTISAGIVFTQEMFDKLGAPLMQVMEVPEGFQSGFRNFAEDYQAGLVPGQNQEAPTEVLDIVQGSLDIAGLYPAAGNIADLGNAAISAYRGHYGAAAFSLAAAIPVIGGIVNYLKVVERADDFNDARKALNQVGLADEGADAARKADFPQPKVVNKTDDVAEEHHLMTNKNNKSQAAGGPFTPKFEELAKRRGIALNDAINKVRLPGHRGPHPAYNAAVYDQLFNATKGLRGKKFNEAFDKALEAVRQETLVPGSVLNKLATGQGDGL